VQKTLVAFAGENNGSAVALQSTKDRVYVDFARDIVDATNSFGFSFALRR